MRKSIKNLTKNDGDAEGNLHKRKKVEQELKPGGASIAVTEENKQDYVQLLTIFKNLSRRGEALSHHPEFSKKRNLI